MLNLGIGASFSVFVVLMNKILRTLHTINFYQCIDRSNKYTLLDRTDCTNASLWSKTALITGNLGGVDPPSSNQMELTGLAPNFERKK